MKEDLLASMLKDARIAGAMGGSLAERKTRVSWRRRQRNKPLPAVVLHAVSDREGLTLDGADGLSETRVQVNCLAASYGAAELLARAVKRAYSGASFTEGETFFDNVEVIEGGDLDGGEEPDNVFGVSLDLFIQHSAATAA